MDNQPRIRIMWIDDRERVTGFPQMELPTAFQKWSEVSHPNATPNDLMSYENVSDFMGVFAPFWFDHKTTYFPVEIIAADFNLLKFPGGEAGSGAKKTPICEGTDSAGEIIKSRDIVRGQSTRDVNFEGLLIGAFYATLTYRHPSALISITNYDDQMPLEVDALRELITPFLSVATREDRCDIPGGTPVWHNLDAGKRSWEKIIDAALRPLRDRIAELYKQGQIVIPPGDLIKIIDGDLSVIRIKSPHALRSLPLKGLFFDNKDDPKVWAEDLLKSRISHERFISAEKVAKVIWSTYNNDVLMDEHAKFSRLHLDDQSNAEYKTLRTKFCLRQTERSRNDEAYECTSKVVSEIRKYKCSPDEKAVQRWAALFLIRRLLKRILLFIDATGIRSVTRDGEQRTQSLYPTFEEDDILLLLYPVPTGPFPLPWHLDDAKLRDNKKSGWRKWMKDNLRFQPKDVLDGSVLTIGERQILQGIVMDKDIEFGPDPETRLERWKSYEPARLFLFGPDTTVGAIEDV